MNTLDWLKFKNICLKMKDMLESTSPCYSLTLDDGGCPKAISSVAIDETNQIIGFFHGEYNSIDFDQKSDFKESANILIKYISVHKLEKVESPAEELFS